MFMLTYDKAWAVEVEFFLEKNYHVISSWKAKAQVHDESAGELFFRQPGTQTIPTQILKSSRSSYINTTS